MVYLYAWFTCGLCSVYYVVLVLLLLCVGCLLVIVRCLWLPLLVGGLGWRFCLCLTYGLVLMGLFGVYWFGWLRC